MKCNGWICTTIGEQLVLQRGYDISKTEQTEGRIPVISSSGVKSYHNQYKERGPGVLLGRKGSIGTVYYTEDDYWPHSTTLFVKDFRGNSPEFVYYFFLSIAGKLKNMDVGTSNPTLNRNHVHPMCVVWPSVGQQKKIVCILRALDKQIELNKKINENLEQQAQAIYQEWFGNTSMAKEQGNLSDICTYSKEKVAVSKLGVSTYFSTENMLPGKAGTVEASGLPTTAQTTACHVGDTLISNIRPYFKKIVYCYEECGCSTDVLCFVPMHPKYSAYLYGTLYADRFFDFMVAGSKGTKMPRGDKQQIMTYPVTLPTDAELERFNSVAVPILTQIQNNRSENKRLSILRDTLLPKLMNGEIEVDE